MEAGAPRGKLAIRQAGRPDRSVPLLLTEVTIGRNPACTLALDYPAVSWNHLRLVWQPEAGYVAIDLNSTHGTVVDGRRIDRPVLLRPQSRIWLGDALGNGVALIYLPVEEGGR